MSDTGPEPQEAPPPPEAPAPAAPAQPSDPPDTAPVAKPRKLIKAVWNPEVRPRAPASLKNLRIPGFFHWSRLTNHRLRGADRIRRAAHVSSPERSFAVAYRIARPLGRSCRRPDAFRPTLAP